MARDAVILCISEQNTTLPDGDYLADLRADHFAGDHDLHPPVRLPACRCVIGSHRLSLAETLRRDRVHRHSLLQEVIADGRATLLGKLLIIVVAADAFRWCFYIQPQTRMGRYDAGDLRQFLARHGP